MAEFKRTTRVKRDYPLFRERLRSSIVDAGMTQSEAAMKVGMDPRTFNHVIAGPTHPDLQLLHDLGGTLDFNLNYLFGLSSRQGKVPDNINPDDFITIGFYETFDGKELMKPEEVSSMVVPRQGFRHVIQKHDTDNNSFYALLILESDCDMVTTGNPVGFFYHQDYISKKAVYSLGINGKNYIRWVEQRLGSDDLTIAKDTLLQDSVTMKPEEVDVYGRMFRMSKDY